MKALKIILKIIIIIFLILCVVLLFNWGLAFFNSNFKYPQLSGDYLVGYQRVEFETNEKEIFDEEVENRLLVADIYFPTFDVGEKTDYGYKKEVFKTLYTPYFLAKPFQSNRMEGVEIADGHFPVLIFSPGMDGSTMFYSSLLEQVASRGFIVVAVNHPYTTKAIELENGEIIKMNRLGNTLMFDESEEVRNKARVDVTNVWANDHSEALNYLLTSSYKDSINQEAIGVFGHSFGGQSALVTLAYDSRFNAGLNMDGSLLHQEPLLLVAQPIGFLFSQFNPPYAYLEENGERVDDWLKRFESKNYPSYLDVDNTYTILGSKHESFATDLLLFKRVMPLLMKDEYYGVNDAREMIDATTDVIVQFFNQHLLGKKDVLNNQTIIYDGIYKEDWKK